MRFKDLVEIQNYCSHPLMPSGGQVIIDDAGLVLTTAERLSKMLEFMESQVNLGCQWSLKLHADCLKVLEMKRLPLVNVLSLTFIVFSINNNY